MEKRVEKQVDYEVDIFLVMENQNGKEHGI